MSARIKNAVCFGTGISMLATAAFAKPVQADVVATPGFSLPYGPGSAASAPYIDMVVNTPPASGNATLTTWGEKGAVGLQGDQSVYPSGNAYVTNPASTVQFKFNIGSYVETLNSTYGAGGWAIANPTLTMQYTYYANNTIFGGGAGTFETWWVANDSWAFGNGAAAGNKYGDNQYVPGTDPAYATTGAALQSWAASEADLGSTTYNWLSPANNPNYTSWSTDKSGLNQGTLTDNLASNAFFLSDIETASAASNPNVSLYLIPTSDTLGLTIFTGGGQTEPTLSFEVVVGVPEPASVGLAAAGITLLVFRRRRAH